LNPVNRHWLLTINYKDSTPPTDDELQFTLENLSNIRYYIYQLEQGEQGTHHHQLYLSFHNTIRFSYLKKQFPTAHIESRRGTHQQARDYCSKDDTRVSSVHEWGDPPDEQGKRSDIIEIYEMINDGFTLKDIREAFPSQYLRYRNQIHTVHQEVLADEYLHKKRDVKVYFIHDNAGVGKTRLVYDLYGFDDIYRVVDYEHPFDSYTTQKVLVLDEFRGQFKIETLLNLLDIYPLKLPARYSNKVACYDTVFIISNVSLDEQYHWLDPATKQALKRRINFHGRLSQFVTEHSIASDKQERTLDND
jgi:hypothetical protein